MQLITIYFTDTGEMMGMVYAVSKVDFSTFESEVRRTWGLYHDEDEISITDFVDFHNENSDVKIDFPLTDYIQL